MKFALNGVLALILAAVLLSTSGCAAVMGAIGYEARGASNSEAGDNASEDEDSSEDDEEENDGEGEDDASDDEENDGEESGDEGEDDTNGFDEEAARAAFDAGLVEFYTLTGDTRDGVAYAREAVRRLATHEATGPTVVRYLEQVEVDLEIGNIPELDQFLNGGNAELAHVWAVRLSNRLERLQALQEAFGFFVPEDDGLDDLREGDDGLDDLREDDEGSTSE